VVVPPLAGRAARRESARETKTNDVNKKTNIYYLVRTSYTQIRRYYLLNTRFKIH
jgi:hypothetical protein